jgi:hypothetical protein
MNASSESQVIAAYIPQVIAAYIPVDDAGA